MASVAYIDVMNFKHKYNKGLVVIWKTLFGFERAYDVLVHN